MRLFIAVELSESIKQSLVTIQQQLAGWPRAIRWTQWEQMHLTLKFLGEEPDDEVQAVCQVTATVAQQAQPFQLELTRCGCFPARGDVRVIHMGVRDGANKLGHCRDLCENAFERLGFSREHRPFTPHLTLGRVRNGKTVGRLREAVEEVAPPTGSQRVDAIFVVRSELTRAGACYSNISRHELGEQT